MSSSLSKIFLLGLCIEVLKISPAFGNPTAIANPEEDIKSRESWLMVQNFRGGSIQKSSDNNDDGTFVLTLNDVGDTLAFTDKPYRLARTYATKEVTDAAVIPKGFDKESPNAVLSVIVQCQSEKSADSDTTRREVSTDYTPQQIDIVVELSNPIYDSKTQSLQYDIRYIKDQNETNTQFCGGSNTDLQAFKEIGFDETNSGVLFVDGFGHWFHTHIWTPLGH
eukprot:Awhi_evm1s10261